MIDQVRSLNNRGVSAAILSSNKGIDKDLVATAKEVSSGKYFLLYTAPEAVVEDHCWRIHFLLYHESICFMYKKPRPDHAQIQSIYQAKGVYREEGMQLTMYPTYSSDFVSETGYAKNRIQYTDVNKWAVLFTEL